MTLRIGVIADIHHGTPKFTKRGDTALALLADFAEWANTEEVDLVLDLGDRISDIDEEADLKLEVEVIDAMQAINAPIHHVCGNHDREFLSVAQNEKFWGKSWKTSCWISVIGKSPFGAPMPRSGARQRRIVFSCRSKICCGFRM